VVTKSTSRQWRKEKVDVVVKIKREQGKTKNLYGKKLLIFKIKVKIFLNNVLLLLFLSA